jgi:hypothetical protein
VKVIIKIKVLGNKALSEHLQLHNIMVVLQHLVSIVIVVTAITAIILVIL